MMQDPYVTLGVTRDADDDAIRSAYLDAIKACPPERDGERFAMLRAAYEQIADQRARIAYELFVLEPPSTEQLTDYFAPLRSPKRPNAAMFEAVLARSPATRVQADKATAGGGPADDETL